MAPKRKPAEAAAAGSSAKKKKQDEKEKLAPGSQLFMVLKVRHDESEVFPQCTIPKGAYSSAEEAYAAAIRFQVMAMEKLRGAKLDDLRQAIVNPGHKAKKNKKKPLKRAYKRMNKHTGRTDFFGDFDAEAFSHVVIGPCPWLGSSPPQLSTLLRALPVPESSDEDFDVDYPDDLFF